MRTLPSLALPGVAVLAASLLACGPTCQSTCERLYQNSPGSCHIQRPDKSESEMFNICMGYCDDALDQTGELGQYDPYQRSSSSAAITLDNESQAAVWMDCVTEQACERLETGYCAPVW